MPYTLPSRTVLITGGSRGLGAVIARKFAAEGCNLCINYANSRQDAEDLVRGLEGEFKVKGLALKADAGSMEEMQRLVEETIQHFGGLDVIISNAGWTRFSPMTDLHDMSESEWDKCWAVNVKGQMALLRAALPQFKKNAEGGAFIMTSSIAGITAAGSSLPYSVTKAAGLRLMKNLANTQGPHARVNSVLPGLLLTEWGMKYPQEAIDNMKSMAALKNVTDLDDCADAYVMLAKNTSMTGVQIKIDAGLRIDPN